jgi:hypothetical protein
VADGFIAATIARDSEIMPKVLASDGSGTGLDADLLDGAHSNAFATSGHSHSAHWHYSLNAADGSPTNALEVDDEGEVGIGTPGDPGSKLDVNGNVNTSGAYKIKGATAFTIQTGPTELNTIIGLAAGHNTGGFANTFMGHGAGGGANSGNRNTFLGYNTGIGNTVGPDNTFIGYAAGDANTTGGRNTIIGSNAGMDSTGSLNTFIGYAAGKSTSAQGNAFIGYEAGLSNIVGEYNNFLGYFAGRSNILGDYNTFVGPLTGMSNTTGHQNTFVGYAAGNENISGGGNTFIGAGAGSQNNGTGNVFLGQEAGPADPAASNQLYIGNYTTKRNTLIYGEFDNTRVGIGTTTPSGTLHVVGGDALEGAGSDITLHAQNAGGPGLNGGDIILLPGDGIIPGMPGGVGIGTTTPTGTLDVAGEIWAQEGLRLGEATERTTSNGGPDKQIIIRHFVNTANTDIFQTPKWSLERTNPDTFRLWSIGPGQGNYWARYGAAYDQGDSTSFGQNYYFYVSGYQQFEIWFGTSNASGDFAHVKLSRFSNGTIWDGYIITTYRN